MNDVLEPAENEDVLLGTISVDIIMSEAEGTIPSVTVDEHLPMWQVLGALEFAVLWCRNEMNYQIDRARERMQQNDSE